MLDYSSYQVVDVTVAQMHRIVGFDTGPITAHQRGAQDLERFERGWKVYVSIGDDNERVRLIRYNVHFGGTRLVVDIVRDEIKRTRTAYLVRGDHHDLTLALML